MKSWSLSRQVALCAAFAFAGLIALSLPSFAAASSIVWGDQNGGTPTQIEITEGGTYAVPLDTPAPAYISVPSEYGPLVTGVLYYMDDSSGSTTRQRIKNISRHRTSGDVELTWARIGLYELDVTVLALPSQQSLNDRIKQFLARIFLAGVAEAQVIPAPTSQVVETIHFTIEEVPDTPTPVIIIPGILGSAEHNDVWVIDPILHTYDDLIATLDANGYTPDTDLFTFPYDWHKSNVDTAILLKQKIDAVKLICTCAKVDIVAHSMGGLVARQYIQSDAYTDDVRKLIFLGTPHLGAPKAYSVWEGGEYSPGLLPIEDSLIEVMLEHEARENQYPSLFAYIRTAPIESVRELLPVYDYIFDENSLRQYPNNYPSNVFLENLNSGVQNLLNSGVQIHNIVGETGTNQTINGIQAADPSAYLPKWEHGYPTGFSNSFGDHGLLRGQGDETVPIASASFVNSNLETTSLAHIEIPSGAEGNIYQILTGKNADNLIDNISIPNIRLIMIKMLSPADLLVIDPDGNKIGKDFTTGLEVNGIPNAFYTGFSTDTEFITILNPLEGAYQIFNQGTEGGGYSVEVAYVSEEETVETSFTGNTLPGLITELDLEVDNANLETLDILPTDTEPPVITIVNPESKDYLHSEGLPVNVSAVDGGSGVFALETLIDDSPIPNVGSLDLFFQSLGAHTLTASSTDNVGNATTSLRTFRVIATIDSTLSDIERIYALGWMSKKVYRALGGDFKDAIIRKPGAKQKGKKPEKIVDKGELKDILRDMRDDRGRGLNEQAYRILKADIEWLINN